MSGHANQPATLPGLLLRNGRTMGDKAAIREKRHGIWQARTWSQHADATMALARGLASMGFARGDRLAVLGDNRPALYQAQLAAMALGGVVVPCWPDASTEWLAHVLADANVSIVVAEDQDQVEKLLDIRDRLPGLREIVFTDLRGVHHNNQSSIRSVADAVALGVGSGVDIEAGFAAGGPDDPCLICYVTPATGPAHAVELTHAEVLGAAEAVGKINEAHASDEYFAYLPMAWVAEQIYGVALPLLFGFACSCPEDPETARRDLRELGPTILLAPPRIWQTLLSEIESKAAHATPLKRRLCATFLPAAYSTDAPVRGGVVAEWLIAAPLRDQLGLGRLRWAHTGGLAMAPHVRGFFEALGVQLSQGLVLSDHPGLAPLATDPPEPAGDARVEAVLCHNMHIADAVVVTAPDGRRAALIAIDAIAVGDWAQDLSLSYTTIDELVALPQVRGLIRSQIEQGNTRLPDSQRISRYRLLAVAPAATNAEASLSRVLQRRIALERLFDLTADTFADPPGPGIETVVVTAAPVQERAA